MRFRGAPLGLSLPPDCAATHLFPQRAEHLNFIAYAQRNTKGKYIFKNYVWLQHPNTQPMALSSAFGTQPGEMCLRYVARCDVPKMHMGSQK